MSFLNCPLLAGAHARSFLAVLSGLLVLLASEARAQNITLPLPIVFEDFSSVAEEGIPPGWTRVNYSTTPLSTRSMQDLASLSYAGWVVVDASRFRSNFAGYASHTPVNYSRVLSFNPANVINGQPVTNLAAGRFLFANSGYREGSAVMFLFTQEFDLSGRTNVHLCFHSIYEQNQDNLAAVEYSTDRGTNWLPLVYYLDGPDVLTTSGAIDAVKTLTNRYSDVATYREPGNPQLKGGYYGAFIGAPISQALAPFIATRVDDDPIGSKRVELYRLPAADNASTVRFRFAYAGADSWYWGIDNFGLYSISPGQMPEISAAPADLEATAGLQATFSVQVSGLPPFSYQWLMNGDILPGETNANLVVTAAPALDQAVYSVIVSNAFGAVQSPGGRLSVRSPEVTGQWDFDYGDLRATIGSDLEFLGNTEAIDQFETVFMGDRAAGVLAFREHTRTQGLLMRHGARPNGGGKFVNRYTLVMDVLWPTASHDHFRALFQTDPFNHEGNEAEFFVGDHTALPQAYGVGAETEFHGPLSPEVWHRVVLAVDLTNPEGTHLAKYIDGVPTGTQSLAGGIDGKYALGPTALLFATGVESVLRTKPGMVNSIQFVDSWLSPEQVAALGLPTALGLPPGGNAVKLAPVVIEGNSLRLHWSGPPGLFELQRALRLDLDTWEVVAGPTSNRSLSLPIQGDTAFYRVRQSYQDMVVGMLPGGAQALPSRQIVRQPGQQLQFGGRPVDLALSPDGATLYIKNVNNLLVVDVATWSLKQTLPYPGSGASMHGIAVRRDGARVYVTGASNELYEWAVQTNGTLTPSRTLAMPAGSYPCGIALNAAGDRAYVCLSIANRLAVVNLVSGGIAAQIQVGVAPWDVVLSPDETAAYVSDWGGRFPGAGDLKASSAGTQVVVDERGVGASGVVSFVNLSENRETGQVPVGLHPCDLELSRDGATLFVANANSDTVSVIDTKTRSVSTILVRPESDFPYGSAATGLALSPDQKTLFVTVGGNNAVGVIDLQSLATDGGSVKGFLPSDWYPGAVAARGTNVFVVNVKGLGTRLGQPHVSSYNIGAHLGTAVKLPVPELEALYKLTAQAFEDGRVPEVRRAFRPARPSTQPVPVPARLGEPSVFKHVLYVIKENKTYDQMFGDMPEGNGMASLCIYPENVSPNHHALAREFVLLDNFYCNGVNSADGHSWSTEANVTDYLEKSFGGFTRAYTFGDDALTYSSTGFIWNNVLRHGLTFRNYGEMDYATPSPNASWMQIYRDFTNGTRAIKYVQNIGIESLRRYSSTNVPGWNLGIPDIVRADGFIRELRAAEAKGSWENFHLLYLPNDHTGGPPSPRAQVADNDLALGQVIEAVTHCRFWTNTVVFVIEDDPQSGYDHVDAHRSICLVVSPYTRRGAVVSTFYNQAGVIHTMERILGLPPMNQQDAMAPIMYQCFTNAANFTPYKTRANNIPLAEGVTAAAAATPAALAWAQRVQSMDFTKPDRINDDLFNRYIWFRNKGDAPYPAEYVGGHGKGLGSLGLLLDEPTEHGDGDPK